jgi:hypothetical protein
LIGDYPFTHKLFRFGYGLYRQFSRRNYGEKINTQLFRIIKRFTGVETSTVEPMNNFPDMFMTSEILDALSGVNPQ